MTEDEAIQEAEQDVSAGGGLRVMSITGDPVGDRWAPPEVLITAGGVPWAAVDPTNART
jgi:hypothetical protein